MSEAKGIWVVGIPMAEEVDLEILNEAREKSYWVPMAEEVGVEMVEVASKVEGEEEDGLGGDGFVVDGGRSPSTLSRDGEDGGENG
ncbi:hypothetical protein Tco_0721682 [Tanacetum coccineum]